MLMALGYITVLLVLACLRFERRSSHNETSAKHQCQKL